MWLFYTSRHRPSIDHDDVIKWKHFRVTGPLWGEFTGPRWIPRTKASDAELWCFLWSVSEYKVEQTMVRLVIWDAISPIMKSLECGKRAPVTAISKKPGCSPRVWQRSPARIYRNDAVTDTILKKKYFLHKIKWITIMIVGWLWKRPLWHIRISPKWKFVK